MRLLILDLDTLRPDHLSGYGYHRLTSPNLDRLISRGTRFTNYYCPDAPCLPSRAALVSGRYGMQTGVVGHSGTAADLRLAGAARGFRGIRTGKDMWSTLAGDNLWGVLARGGLPVSSISPFAARHDAWWFNANLRETFDTGRGGMESAEEVTPAALDWIRRNARRENWALHINYWDPHTPYRAPADFGNPFRDEPPPAWVTPDLIERHLQAVGPHSCRELNMWNDQPHPEYPRHVPSFRGMEGWKRHIDGYDCGIAYMDAHIGQLLDALDAEGALDDLAIIITSDHGENQGELGIYSEHATADQATCRIPMVVCWPGMKQGQAAAGLHANIDLIPTLAELLGVEPSPRWEGKSFAATLRTGADAGRGDLVLSQCAHVCQRSVRWDNWLHIRTWHDGFHLFPDEMLFDVEADPRETNDLAPERPEILHEAAHRYQAWHDRMMGRLDGGARVDPMRTVLAEGGPTHTQGMLDEYCQRLMDTERAWAVPLLQARHGQKK